MRIAIVGTGISGMTAAYLLSRDHDITVFEAGDYVGGHTHTVDVSVEGSLVAVDTGFIVCNDRTYPNFLALLAKLGVMTQPSDMSFSVRCEKTGLEYSGGSWNGLFAQRRNLVRPSFYRLLADIIRFNREAPKLLDDPDDGPSLGDYLTKMRYRPEFMDRYLVPMGAAIWSSQPDQMLAFPAKYLVLFFRNHGLLEVFNRPQWLTIRGGSRSYIGPLTAPYRDRIRLNTPVLGLRRTTDGVVLKTAAGEEVFDHAVLATHANQSTRMLSDATSNERAVLGALPYQENEVVLHKDESLLPRSRRAWSSWNYHLPVRSEGRATVTYWMNRLQNLPTPTNLSVTLNRTSAIAARDILGRYVYHHPVYTQAGVSAQTRWAEINGKHRVSFCGAYWGFGFHEDGVNSALAVAREFGISP